MFLQALWTSGEQILIQPVGDSSLTVQFFNHFREQNDKIAKGTVEGIHLEFNSLGIINGIIDEAIQV